ncbi:MAG: 4-alpha-glucanotransferase [Candidatus Velthaea sp.]|jgi:4-alpha-glucanotransferase
MIGERYVDALGRERVVPGATRAQFAAVLAASAPAEAPIPPAIVISADDQPAIVTTLPSASWTERVQWVLTTEQGQVRRGAAELREAPVVGSFERDGLTIDRRRVALGPLAEGYHRIALDCGAYGRAEAALIVAPPRAYAPGERVWGLAVQLYTLRSPRNWGIGDFGDLHAVVDLAAAAGARYVGLNPLHAGHRGDPDAASPYAPTSRRFLNWLAIDVAALPEAAAAEVAAAIAESSFQATLADLRATHYVDYVAVAAAKDLMLRRCFAVFERERPGDREFAAFVRNGGSALERFAVFETLVARLGRDPSGWPAPYREANSAAVQTFADAERLEVRYAIYLQWCAARQLHAAAEAGAAQGVRLYRDLAVGVDAGGADVWAEGPAYVRSASIGAPPDALNVVGQDWNLPPLDPNALVGDGYRTFAELLRANMADAGALRIDHVMSLARLFWIPRGAVPADGAYIAYPLADLTAIVALESCRARCVVVGEDLGTVPDGFRERMAAADILSYRILFFERDGDGAFIPPEQYPEKALAASGTHDLPPFAQWYAGGDIDVRAGLGFLPVGAVAGERIAREADRRRLIAALIGSGDLAIGAEPALEDVVLAAHRYLARSRARIVMLQLDDALGELDPVNVPGTSTQYPNWRRKLTLDMAQIATDRRFAALTGMLAAERPRSSPAQIHSGFEQGRTGS